MKKNLLLLLLFTVLLVCLLSCDKSEAGYIEVRNKTQFVIEDVSWGRVIHLGTLQPNEENGTETELFGEEFIHLKIKDKQFRSKDKIVVDAKTSATFIVKDTTNLLITME